MKCTVHKSYKRQVWLYSQADFVAFNEDILNHDWETAINNIHDVNEACNYFTDKYIEIAEKNIPQNTITVRINDKPWFNSEIRREIRKKERLRKKAKTGNSTALLNYKRQRNHVNNMKKYARETFYLDINNMIDQHTVNDKKEFWKLIRFVTKTGGTYNAIPPLINPDTDSIEIDDKCKADVLNKYFSDISTIDDSNVELPDFNSRTDEKLSDVKFDQEDIIDILLSLNVNKAVGIDSISHHMLRNTAHSVSLPLMILFKRCLAHGIFPSAWKKARVMPLFKKDNRHTPSNYRPIALLSTVGKVFERLIHKDIHNYMLENNLLYKLQSGFLPNNSTVFQLLEIYHHICLNRKNKLNTCFVFCDVSKAFDKVWHAGLLLKLKAYGITGALYSLLKNYLSDRQQCVMVNSSVSDFRFTTSGVPQGSVLGPLLFLIFINDIADNLINIARLFADDTSLSSSSKNKQEITENMNTDLCALEEWSARWLVTFNPSKTEVLYINATGSDDIELQFGGTTLHNVNEHKHLGITLMSNGKWTSHIDNICNSAYKQINVLRKLKYTLNRETLLKIYNTFILPCLEYACEVWDGLGIRESEKLEKIQLEAGRIATGLPLFSSKESIYFETGWEPLKNRRERRKLCLFYKIHNNLVPQFLSDILSPMVRANTRNLRNNDDYSLPRYRLESTEMSFFPSTIKLWNSLNYDLRHGYTFNQFKFALKSNSDVHKVPCYFLVGDRRTNILLTRIRNMCSCLNADLNRVNLTDSPVCNCGNPCEDAYHFLMECPNYTRYRTILFDKLRNFEPLNVVKLLFGDFNLNINDNKIILLSVQEYIKATKRFN